jgi:hypothetical protein
MSRDGQLRASDADRELAVSMLQQAATEGRLDPDELDERVQRALRARTYAELADTVVDLPAGEDRRQRRAQARRGEGATPPWAVSHPRSRRAQAGRWTARTVRHNPSLLFVLIPLMAIAATFVLAFAMIWLTVMAVVMIAGGQRRTVSWQAGPWAVGWSTSRPLRPGRHRA